MKLLLIFENDNTFKKYIKDNHSNIKKHKNLAYSKFKKMNFSITYLILIFLLLIQEALDFLFPIKEISGFHIQSNEISLKIHGSGEQIIIGGNNDLCPNKIYLNSNLINIQNSNCKKINIPEGSNINTIKLVFNEEINNLYRLFAELTNIVEIDFSKFDGSLVTHMGSMFYGSSSIKSINFVNMNTSKVKNMEYMFYNCSSLISLDLSNFNTKNVKTMTRMFSYCYNLTHLDLSSFNTESLETIDFMFYFCISLTSLNLANFYTPKLTSMNYVFESCISLTFLDLSHFNISNVLTMNNTFFNLQKLESLDLSSFSCNKITYMGYLFYKCYKLKYLNLKNFKTNLVSNMESMFAQCLSLKSLDLSSFDTSNVATMETMFCNCTKLSILNLSHFDTSSLTNVQRMFQNCYNIEYINFKEYNGKNVINSNGMIENIRENAIICIKDNNNFYNVTEIINEKPCASIDCSDNWKDKQIKIIDDNRTCIENCSNFNYEIHGACYSICPEDEDFCQPKNTEIKTLNVPGDNNEEIYQEIINDIVINYNKRDNILVEAKDNFTYQITTLENEKNSLAENNITNRLSKINLGECEDLLKNYYNIDKDISLIIIKYEKSTNISLERSLQYEVYEPIYKKKLNLSICENTTIDLYIPVKLSNELGNLYNELKDKGYDLFDINSTFYQDICTPFKSSNGTDVLLSDRVDYYYNNDETLCQSNCKFSNYSMEKQLLKCECDVSNSEINSKEFKKFTPKIFYQNFYDTLKFSNYKVLKCHNLAFNIKNMKSNIGNILSIIYFLLYLVSLIFYFIKGIRQLKEDFEQSINKNKNQSNNELNKEKDNIIMEKKDENTISTQQKNQNNTKKIKVKRKIIRKSLRKKVENENIIDKPLQNDNISNEKFNNKRKSFQPRSKNIEIHSKRLSDNFSLISVKKNNLNQVSEINNEKENKTNNIFNSFYKLGVNREEEKLDEFELNNLEYDKATVLDKRVFIDIYWSVLKREHIIIFTFFIRNDHNILYIKFARFIFLVCTDMALNVFFFADETMHKMFLDYGKYNFLQQIPQIIYSKLVSQLIEVFLCFLSMTDKYFYEIKKLNNNSPNAISPIIKCIKIKLLFFIIFTFLMFLFYWYIVTCFCVVYENTQIAFIKDSLSSFALGLLYPFALYLFPVALRLISLRTSSKLSWLYFISDIIPFF